MKKFKGKHKRKISLFKITFFIILTFSFYYYFNNILFKFKLASSNQEFLSNMLKDSNHHLDYKNDFSLENIFKCLFPENMKKEEILLETAFHYNYESSESDAFEDEKVGNQSEYVYDPNPSIIQNPIVYIYNTHQLESYDNSEYSEYNITPNVLMTSYMLKEKLNKLGIPTIIETANINEFMNLNNMSYYQSYEASRFYLIDTLKKYPNLKLIIDLHRDAIEKEDSTITIDDENYAKLLFVVGTEYENYEKNLSLANKLNDIIKNKYPKLSRGVLTKSGNNVNGIYNQDLNNNIVLIECGAYKNTMEEVMNTVEVLSHVIKEYIENGG